MSKPWTTIEEAHVRAVHASGTAYAQMMHLWPGRNSRAVACHASEMGLGERPVPIRRDVSQLLPVILRQLKKGAADAYAIADELDMCREWAGRLLRKELQSEAPKVQVIRWTRSANCGPYREVWALGSGEIADKPAKLSRVERKRLAKLAEQAAQSSPFSVAAGLTSVPVDRPGRVYRHLLDDDREAA